MKILFDALASTRDSGGMRLHSTELIAAWVETFPADEVHVLAPRWATHRTFGRYVFVHRFASESVVTRFAGQFLGSALVGYLNGVDQVVSLSPIVTPLYPKARRSCFQHDWRHKKNPSEFGVLQHIYRRFWAASAKWSSTNFCISEKAMKETLAEAPQANAALAPNGRDHARRWSVVDSEPLDRVVTFGHHNNKRPELLIRAFALLAGSGGVDSCELVVLGARGTYADQLRLLATELGVEQYLKLPGFVSDTEYSALISTASVIALLSSDEGFGLPLAEAEYFGIPSLVATDSGVAEFFPRSAVPVDPDPSSVALGIMDALSREPSRQEAQAIWRWADTARSVRSTLVTHAQGNREKK